jgi:hypothetical protein
MRLTLQVIDVNGVTYYGIKVGMSTDDGDREFDGDVAKILCVAQALQALPRVTDCIIIASK